MLRLLVLFFLLISLGLTFPYYAFSNIKSEDGVASSVKNEAEQRNQDSISVLMKVIDLEVAKSIEQIEQNKFIKASNAAKLIHDIKMIWSEIKAKGFYKKSGLDSELRPSMVSLQAIIEKSIAIALSEKRISSAEGFVIAPHMASPLMISQGKSFSEIEDFNNPKSLIELRRMILEACLTSGMRLNTVYSHNAASVMAVQTQGLEIFKATLKTFEKNLKDFPVIKNDMKAFPIDKTGAIYFLDNDSKNAIAIRSLQISQNKNPKKLESAWEISFGNHSSKRVEEINQFFKENDQIQLIR